MSIKEIKTFNYENSYKNNIQMQFADDLKFCNFIQSLSNFANEYQLTLKKLNDGFSNTILLENPNIFTLNSIGNLIGLPPMGYFSNLTDGTYTNRPITLENYKLLIRGQQANNQYDGTNKGLKNVLSLLFPSFRMFLEDSGEMAIKLYLVPLLNTNYCVVNNDETTDAKLKTLYIDSQKFISQVGTDFIDDNYMLTYTIADGYSLITPDSETIQISNIEDYGIYIVGTFLENDNSIFDITIKSGIIDPQTQYLFEEGFFTPKPAGVNMERQVLSEIYFAWDTDYDEGPPITKGWDNSVWI